MLKKGNIFESNTEAIVNTVNCVGVMGKGLALQFKKKYPENFMAYKNACDLGQVKVGKMFVYKANTLFGNKYIINFPTKKHWRNPSKLEYIVAGLDDLIEIIKSNEIKSIAIPPLGCGLGGLDWVIVKRLIVSKFLDCNLHETVDIYLFEGGEKQ